MNRDEIIERLESMTVLDLVELQEDLGERWSGVSETDAETSD